MIPQRAALLSAVVATAAGLLLTAAMPLGAGAPERPPVWRPRLPLAGVGVEGAPAAGPTLVTAEISLVEQVDFDPETRTVRLAQRRGEVEVGRPARYPADRRVAGLAGASQWRAWERAIRERRRRSAEEAGGSLLGDLTRIDIPIQFPSAVGSIIGQGANIEVSGSEEITFGGESNYIVESKDYGFGQRSRFPQLDMRQHLRVNLNGTIGEKIQVLVEHDSEVQTALENKIKLRYAGNEDEVIQSIEMGNTNLSLGGAQFVGYRGQAQGLFGAKLQGRLGSLDFSAIASKQEGRTSRETFVGQAKEEETVVKDVDYEKRRFFSVRLPSDPRFLAYPAGRVESLTVWVNDHRGDNDIESAAQAGVAFRSWDPGADCASQPDTVREAGFKWVRMDELDDYTVNFDAGVIALTRAVPADWSLAVAYYSPVQNGWVGDAAGDTLCLQMVHPATSVTNNWYAGTEGAGYSDRTEWYELLGMELRNVYFLGARSIARDEYEIKVRRASGQAGLQADNQRGVPFIRVMGLDRGTYSSAVSDTNTTDDIVDPEWIDFDAGLLYLPNSRPFDPENGIPLGSRPLDYQLDEPNPSLYAQSEDYLRLHQELLKYEIVARYRTPQTTFRLNRIGIIRDSEVVTLNGRRLTRGADYQIDYDLGQVTFLIEEASGADAQISIDFEYAPLLAQAQKTLFGLSGIYKFTEANHLGATFLYETSTTPELRPRLGQEPTRTLVGDVNFQLATDSDRATRWVDAVPLVSARTPSQLRLAGELAASLPNPNTKNEIYLEDMDGSEDVRSLTATWRLWMPASRPLGREAAPSYRPNWYSPRDLVRERDLFLALTGNEGDALRTVLEMRPHPAETPSADSAAWFGIQRLVSAEGANLSEEKFLEVWVDNGSPAERHGKMHLDLGDISEDFYRPGERTEPDDEDANHDGILDEIEDVGLDGVAGKDADGVSGDDGNDDFDYDFDRARYEYGNINGFEGNRGADRLRDSEDLNHNGRLDRDHAYFTVEVDLSDDPPDFLAVDNADSLAGEGSSWRLFRIPLADIRPPLGVSRTPVWTAVRSMRIWFEGFAPGEHVRIGSLDIMGNAWLEDGIRKVADGDTVLVPADGRENLSVQVRNNKEHSEYTPPFQVEEEQTPQGRIARREQSLALVYEELGEGHGGGARKIIPLITEQRLNDYSEYRSLSFFVRAQHVEPAGRPPVFFVRLGADSSNFYEYRLLLDQQEGWRSVDVSLEDLPRVKLDSPDTVMTYNRALGIEVRDPRRKIPLDPLNRETRAVYGKPSLTRILYLALGVRNEQGDPISGEVWVDELRLREVRREPGTVGQLSASVQLADLAGGNFTLMRRDSEFRTLGGDRSGSDEERFTAGGRFNLNKFMERTGLALPLSYNVNSSTRRPRLLTGSDIVLDPALQEEERTASADRSASFSLSHPATSATPWGRLLLDGFQASVGASRAVSSSPELESTQRRLTGSAQYLLAPPFDARLGLPREFKLGYLPQSLTLRAEGSRATVQSYTMKPGRVRGTTREDRITRSLEGTLNLRAVPLESGNMSTEYNFDMVRDLDTGKEKRLRRAIGWGSETRRHHSAGWRFQPGLFGLVTPLLTYQTSYDEDQSPQIRRAGDPPGLRQIQNSGEFRANASVSPQTMLRRLAGWWGERERRSEQARQEKARVASEQAGRAESPPLPETGPPVPEPRADSLLALPPPPEEPGMLPWQPPEGPPESPPPGPAPEPEGAPDAGGPAGPEVPPAAPPPPAERGPGILERLARASRKLQDISVNYSVRRSSRYQRTLERPPLAYQFGFTMDAPGEDRATLAGQSSSSRSRNRALSLRSGFRPVTGMNVDMSYTGSRIVQDAAGSVSENRSLSWPDLTLTVSSLEQWAPIKRFTDRASFTSGVRRKIDETVVGGELRDRKWQLAFSPLFQLSSTWPNGLQLTVSGNHSRSSSENRRGVGGLDRSTSSSLSAGARYALRTKRAARASAARGQDAGGGEVKLSADLRLTSDQSERKVGGSERWEQVGKTTGFSLEPQASYSFQGNITGSAQARFAQNRDHKRGETRRRIGLFVSLSIRF